jgi:hypothetical protein
VPHEIEVVINEKSQKDRLRDSIRQAWLDSPLKISGDQGFMRLMERTTNLHKQAEDKLIPLRHDEDRFDEFWRIHEEFCREIIAPCVKLVKVIENIMEQSFSEKQARLYRLSRMLDRVIYREEAYFYCNG